MRASAKVREMTYRSSNFHPSLYYFLSFFSIRRDAARCHVVVVAQIHVPPPEHPNYPCPPCPPHPPCTLEYPLPSAAAVAPISSPLSPTCALPLPKCKSQPNLVRVTKKQQSPPPLSQAHARYICSPVFIFSRLFSIHCLCVVPLPLRVVSSVLCPVLDGGD